MKALSFLLLFVSIAHAAPFKLKDFDWSIDDIADKGYTTQQLYNNMDTQFIRLGSSICANRALMWLYDFKRYFGIDGGKVFLFYTENTIGEGDGAWWYHVAPVVVERGQKWVLDAGFDYINEPLTLHDWIGTFSEGHNCKEISAKDTDLIQLMNEGGQFPVNTRHGSYDCYYILAPAGLWFPTTVASHLQNDEYDVNIQENEVFDACVEASTTRFGEWFGGGKKKCKRYMGW